MFQRHGQGFEAGLRAVIEGIGLTLRGEVDGTGR
jgi:hypothetical protein